MPTNERPGVYSSVELSSSLLGSGTGKVVGLAAAATAGTKGKCVKLTGYGEAVSEFGAGSSLTALVEILFRNGAQAVIAVAAAVNAAATTQDYTDAFAALMEEQEVCVMVCDSAAAQVTSAMKAAIASAAESCKYRVGVVETGGTVAEACDAAEALNYERMAMVYPAQSGDDARPGAVAAALAGLIAAGTDPALPLNGAVLLGADTKRRFTDTEIATLVQAGVTPAEYASGEVSVVRAVTTRSMTNSVADATWRELTTVLVIDDVIPGIRAALRRKFPRVKNTAQTRGAIRTQVLIELEKKLQQEIIDGYGTVTAQAEETDPTVCEVSFDFTVAHGLNSINLTAHISV